MRSLAASYVISVSIGVALLELFSACAPNTIGTNFSFPTAIPTTTPTVSPTPSPNPLVNCSSGFATSGLCGTSFIGGGGQAFAVVGSNAGSVPTLSGSRVNLIPYPSGHEALSLLYQTPVNVQAFSANFTFIPNGKNISFVLNNTNNQGNGAPFDSKNFSAGAGCEGGFFQAFGTSPNNVFALELDSGDALTPSGSFSYSSVQVYQSQQDPCEPTYQSNYSTNKISTFPVPLNSPTSTTLTTTGHTYSATIAYDGTTLTLNLYDITAHGSCPGSNCFTQTWSAINIPSLVAGTTAYAGIVGGTNSDAAAALYVNSFVYTVDPPPTTPSISTFTTSLGGPYATTPTLSPAAGTYSGTQNVTISSSTSGSYFCYILSATTPPVFPWPDSLGGCQVGVLYTSPVSVSSTETLYVVAGTTASAGLPSSLKVGTYTIVP